MTMALTLVTPDNHKAKPKAVFKSSEQKGKVKKCDIMINDQTHGESCRICDIALTF